MIIRSARTPVLVLATVAGLACVVLSLAGGSPPRAAAGPSALAAATTEPCPDVTVGAAIISAQWHGRTITASGMTLQQATEAVVRVRAKNGRRRAIKTIVQLTPQPCNSTWETTITVPKSWASVRKGKLTASAGETSASMDIRRH